MPLYTYRCEHGGHATEAIRSMGCAVILCPVCEYPARRQATNHVAIGRFEGDTRGMFRRFQEASHEMDYAATRRESAGETVRTPNLWQDSKRRAQAIERAGEGKETREKIARR